MKLVEPSLDLEAPYRAFLEEFQDLGEDMLVMDRLAELGFRRFVEELRAYAEGRGLPEGWVAGSRLWLVAEEGEILGEVDIRHELTPALEDFGGHIGYWVRPSRRGEGLGTAMLALALDEARALALNRVLITCDPKNTASVRVIEKNGGRLASQSVAKTGRITSRYWIEL